MNDTITRHLEGPQTRDFQTRVAVTEEGREVTAIGVPFDSRTELWPGFYEEFAPGSVDDKDAILRYGHREPIGKLISTKDTTSGREITGVISRTARGDDIVTLLADEVLTRMSIGFHPETYEITDLEGGGQLIRHIKVKALEYSIVEFPAYNDAKITNIRTNTEGEHPMPDTSAQLTDTAALEERMSDLERQLALAKAPEPDPVADRRSIGELVKAIAAGDESARNAVAPFMSRDYEGGTISDDGTLTPIWVKDLTRIIEAVNPISRHFAKGPLPAEGMQLEYTQLLLNSIEVSKQDSEGDALASGKVSLTKTLGATIETYGGANTMSFQEIQRSRANMVSLTMKAMAAAAGKEAADVFHAFYEAEVIAQAEVEALTYTKDASELAWADLLEMILDASKAYQDLGLSLDGTILDRDTFLAIGSLTDEMGRPLMSVTGDGSNTVGRIDARHLKGELAGLTFIPDFDSALDEEGINGTFFHSEALRQYTSGIAHLQDENILNLTRDMAVYYYAANASEIPAGLLPIKLGDD